MSNLTRLDAFCGESEVNVIVETPKGSRNKYDYDPKERLFTLSKVLPAGAVFPFDFGFVPSTLCEDGDPLDIVLLMDEPAFPGCKVQARLIGVIEAEQTEKDGKTVRNDRLLAAAMEGCSYSAVRSLYDLPPGFLDCIEHFFVSYNEMAGKQFKLLGRQGPGIAAELVMKALQGDCKSARGAPVAVNGKKKGKKG